MSVVAWTGVSTTVVPVAALLHVSRTEDASPSAEMVMVDPAYASNAEDASPWAEMVMVDPAYASNV